MLLQFQVWTATSGRIKTAWSLGRPLFVKVGASRWCFIAAGPSDGGSLVRGHIATVAWTGSVGCCIKSYLAFCKSVGQEVCLDLWPRPEECEPQQHRVVVTRSAKRLGRAVETVVY